MDLPDRTFFGMEDVTRSAQKAIDYDKAGRYDAAIYFYGVGFCWKIMMTQPPNDILFLTTMDSF